MGRIALYNKKGMTLIEVMIALLILMIVSMALLQTALLGMKENGRNAIRDEAVRVAEQRMNELRSYSFEGAELAAGTVVEPVISRTFRAMSVPITPKRIISQVGSDSKQITMEVSWPYSGQTYIHSVTTIMRRQ